MEFIIPLSLLTLSPIDTVLPLITPSVLSTLPCIFIPYSILSIPVLLFSLLFSLSASSFVSPSDNIYPLTFFVSSTLSSILPSLLTVPFVLSNVFPFTSSFSV